MFSPLYVRDFEQTFTKRGVGKDNADLEYKREKRNAITSILISSNMADQICDPFPI